MQQRRPELLGLDVVQVNTLGPPSRSTHQNRGRQPSRRVSESIDSFSLDRHETLDFRVDLG